MKILCLVFVLSVVVAAQTPKRTISVTIDDLPIVNTRSDIETRRDITKRLLGHVKKAKVPAVGFVNENKLYKDGERDPQQIALLQMWLDAGLELGNHSFSHRSAEDLSVEDYTKDILRGEVITKELLAKKGMKMRYYRHPFLQTASDLTKKAAIYKFLADHNYTVAPVSFDNGDYIFARAYDYARDKGDTELMKRVGAAYVPYMESKLDYWERQSVKTLGREISQTMLMHANSINAEYFDDLAVMMKKRGYKFVTLEESLKDDAYKLPDTFARRGGISWIHRWTLDKGREFLLANEPMVPEFVLKASGFESE